MYMCMYMYVYMYCVCVFMCAYGGQRTISAVSPQSIVYRVLFFLTESLSDLILTK